MIQTEGLTHIHFAVRDLDREERTNQVQDRGHQRRVGEFAHLPAGLVARTQDEHRLPGDQRPGGSSRARDRSSGTRDLAAGRR